MIQITRLLYLLDSNFPHVRHVSAGKEPNVHLTKDQRSFYRRTSHTKARVSLLGRL